MNAKLVFVTGGARSGKSSFAERLALDTGGNVAYVATGLAIDGEMAERIRIHRSRRPASWKTFESYRNLDALFEKMKGTFGAVLLDCLTIMVTNLLFDKELDWDAAGPAEIAAAENDVHAEIGSLIDAAKKFSGLTIAVSNELGMGLVPPTPLGRHFRDIMGRVNQTLASAADEVYLLVSGIPVRIKG